MPMTKVKERFQVTIPQAIWQAADLAVGDFLEVAMEGKSIVLKPKVSTEQTSVEAAIAAGLRDYEEGRVTPAFSSMKEFEEFLAAEEK